ncbi:polysaccharide pyruvyl transferase family protein [Aliarcobacter cryaerophilus]|uniref:polysaccharide pyruvyl transferase family protein n=1 Tax=Aliarcobacter cryaerophilus TaxID=28198 RepID=UPI0021B6E0A8|nr:polysaccharide pyruvyl transferase family protein [Aliarcobacter cryaerophilus]MCT7520529.1 polysaccharide pyruvyl transferase family protein [Aliarcobacter cryaerophilus]
MKITIIGWYGTETIGDRAILAGLFSFFNKSYEKFEIKLGSLYPFFSERTINEDYSFYKEIINKDFKIEIFNSKNSKELNEAIKSSDLIAMGGGPLMDLPELFMVEYSFKKAKKLGKKTALLGCGVGPLFHKKYRKSVLEISKNSDITILRDKKSKDNLEEIYKEFNQYFKNELINTSFDPAVECTLKYNKQNNKVEEDYIAVNLREFPLEYIKNNESKNINKSLKDFIKDLALKYSDRKIKLIPMHYFYIGGDDRVFLNSIAFDLNLQNIEVQNANLTLKETIEVYQNAYFNVGMRFHSVVLQTISSGKNYVLDYTEPKKGKIFGFLQDIDKDEFYKNRYISLQEDEISSNILINEDLRFELDIENIEKYLNIYIEKLKEIE